MTYKAVVIGVSAGGISALSRLLPALNKDFKIPVIIVQHIGPQSDSYLVKFFDKKCSLKVKEAEDKECISPGHIYFAPPDYHLLIEHDKTFSLSIDERVNYSRPSIDVLFESAADAYSKELIGIVLTGANHDGSKGLKKIKDHGGLAIVQDPKTAEVDTMPINAIKISKPHEILSLEQIASFLIGLDQ